MFAAINKATKKKLIILLTILFWTFVFLSIWPNMLTIKHDGLYAGWVNIWGDWAAHISYTSYLSYQNTFPPEFPILAGHVLSYPFGADLISALLIRLGLDLVPSMIIPSVAMSVVLIISLLFFFNTTLKNPKSASIAVFLFLLNGGLGFLWFGEDFKQLGWEIFSHFPREYTHLQKEANIEWINVISSEFIPQRGFLFGMPIALLVLSLFWKAYKNLKEIKKWQFILAGIGTGLLPLVHMHSLVIILGFFLWTLALSFLKYRTKTIVWIYYLLPAVVLIYLIISVLFSHIGGSFIKFFPGWLALQAGDNIITFWIKNAGIMFVLPLFALKLIKRDLLFWSVPFWGIFVLANLFLFQPFPWDNTKFFTYWWLGASAFGAVVIEHILSYKVYTKPIALLVFLVAIASGSLDVIRLTQFEKNKIRMVSQEGLEIAQWARLQTPPESIFLTANNHDHPITMLSGRRVVLGFPGWLWTYGIDTGNRQELVNLIYSGSPLAKKYLEKLDVDYVAVGPAERNIQKGLDMNFLESNFPVAYQSSETTIFKMPQKQTSLLSPL